MVASNEPRTPQWAKSDLFDMTILGSVLNSFYQGLENIFELIAKKVDGFIPTGSKTHKELLHQMASENEKRNEVISDEQYEKLLEYAGFRHFYRHAYGFQLRWDKMEMLVNDLDETWKSVKLSLEKFIES